jgi:hypothetical protein
MSSKYPVKGADMRDGKEQLHSLPKMLLFSAVERNGFEVLSESIPERYY